MISNEQIVAWITALQQVYHDQKEHLTQLDSAIGDADHGINLDRGFTAAADALESQTPPDISATLKAVAMTLIKTVGGASGPLYGTFFLRASAAVAEKAELQAADVAAMCAAGVEGIIQRGKAQVGDKTMLDALVPAVYAMQQAAESDVRLMLEEAVEAAEQGMRATVLLQARKGRASYLGERSIGHQDPGATSAYLLLKTAQEVWIG